MRHRHASDADHNSVMTNVMDSNVLEQFETLDAVSYPSMLQAGSYVAVLCLQCVCVCVFSNFFNYLIHKRAVHRLKESFIGKQGQRLP